MRRMIIAILDRISNKLNTKCKYHMTCEHYQDESPTCNENAGTYYSDVGYCGMYRRLEGWE